MPLLLGAFYIIYKSIATQKELHTMIVNYLVAVCHALRMMYLE